MFAIIFDLEQENIRLSSKILTIFSTDAPAYLLFIIIRDELDDVKEQTNYKLDFEE